MTFGEKIKSTRLKKNLSQRELAEKVGVSPSTIQNYESDLVEPKFINVICLSEVLGVSLDYLAGKKTEDFKEVP